MEDRTPAPAPRTLNTYLSAAKAMLNWAVQMRLLPYNPIDCLKPRPEKIKKHRRRALSLHEVEHLIATARVASLGRLEKAFRGKGSPDKPVLVSPHEREAAMERGRRNALTWQILCYTGLRVNELRSLRWIDIDLEKATLRVRPETAKGGREDLLPLMSELTSALKEERARTGAQPGDPVVSITPNTRKQLYKDLKDAGIPRVDASGRKIDVHALRHTFGTLLAQSGADLKTVQSLMRHANPILTFGFYVHRNDERLRDAVAQIKPTDLSLRKKEAGSAG
jgi:integrase